MGAACCKRFESVTTPTSPHLPFCEVVRRCARQICPIDPPHNKTPVHRFRKYGLSDIVGPVQKKDSWVQTDPLPPPRRRKRKEKLRRRSRSVEFLPYLIRSESSRTSGSLEDIAGQEDALDFQMYFMNRLPRNGSGDGKDSLYGRKREFLSGLLGEENNNSVGDKNLNKLQSEPTENGNIEEKIDDKKQQSSGEGVTEAEHNAVCEPNSRRSSITESLREFESSLLDMLEEDDCSLTKDQSTLPKEITPVEDGETIIEKMRKASLTTVEEEKEDEYIITPLEEEQDLRVMMVEKTVTKMNEHNQSNRVNEGPPLNSNGPVINTSSLEEKNDEKTISNPVTRKDDLSNRQLKNQPPTITVEIIS